jgi:FtsP/CotA-like multicopper oxidase with cupredoxin domain
MIVPAAMLTRRQFALASAAFAAGGFVGGRLVRGEPAHFTTHLPLPALIDAAKQGHSVKLRAMPGRHSFVKGKPAHTYGYSAPILGPVIRLRRNDEVEMTVENALDVDTTVHWHGLLMPGDVDGGPHQIIKPGGTWRPVLKVAQPATTAWFHPHPHHDTGRQVYMGLAGMIVVDDGTDHRLGLPRTYGVDDLPIILQDRSFDSDGSLVYELDSLTIIYGGRGDTIIVNGVIAPFAKVPRGLVRLRLLNAANAQNYELRFSDHRKFHVIASDSGFLARPVEVSELRISPAERFEILVDFADGRPVVLETGPDELMGIFGAVSMGGTDEYAPVMRFEPTATTSAVRAVPAHLVEPAAADASKAVRRRRFELENWACSNRRPTEAEMDMGRTLCINGKAHDPARIDVETELGTLEVWEIVSIGMAHPFHVHGAAFRILSLKGAPPPAHLAGWKDVALVEDEAELLVAFNQPAAKDHPFMYHCHILEHEDAGMMGQYVCA